MRPGSTARKGNLEKQRSKIINKKMLSDENKKKNYIKKYLHQIRLTCYFAKENFTEKKVKIKQEDQFKKKLKFQ